MNKIKRKFIMQYYWCWHVPSYVLKWILAYILGAILTILIAIPYDLYKLTEILVFNIKENYIRWLKGDYKAARRIKENKQPKRRIVEE